MHKLRNEIRPYEWGSHTVLAELTGRPSPTDEPEAEMWLGAHPVAPSRLADVPGEPTLNALIERDPEAHLGAGLVAEYGSRLPFLFKVLAAERPLSIQAHPSAAHARAAYADEEARGIGMDDPSRNYRDPYAKPEIFVAESDCEVLCGFRSAPEAAALLSRLGIASLAPYVASLLTDRPAVGLRTVVTTLLSMPAETKHTLSLRVKDEAGRLAERLRSDEAGSRPYRWAVRLGEAYPGDIGIVVSLLLNAAVLRPGQAVYLGPGVPHAYLRGWGLEAQANSDNVLRGGLTSKHVDIAELMRVLDFVPMHEPVIDSVQISEHAARCSGARSWTTPAREFALYQWHLDGNRVRLDAEGPQIVLCVDGEVTLECGDGRLTCSRGESAYIPAAAGAICASGHGRLAHVAPGQVPRSR